MSNGDIDALKSFSFSNVYLVVGFGFRQKRRRWAFCILHGVCEAMILVWARRLIPWGGFTY